MGFMWKIHHMLNHNTMFMKVVPVVKKTGLPILVRDLQEASTRRKTELVRNNFALFYEKNKEKFQKLRDMLDDEFSKKTLDNVVRFRIEGDRRLIKEVVVQPQYFLKNILTPQENEVFIDGGVRWRHSFKLYQRLCEG